MKSGDAGSARRAPATSSPKSAFAQVSDGARRCHSRSASGDTTMPVATNKPATLSASAVLRDQPRQERMSVIARVTAPAAKPSEDEEEGRAGERIVDPLVRSPGAWAASQYWIQSAPAAPPTISATPNSQRRDGMMTASV